MTKLVDLGFILTSRDGNREFGQVAPSQPLGGRRGVDEKSKLPEGWWTSFVGRAQDIGTTLPKAIKLPKDVKRMK